MRFLWLAVLFSSGTLFAQQRDCCWCKTPTATFGVEVPAGFGSGQCRIACSSSGGNAAGFKHGQCYPPPPNSCKIELSGGDCKGNNWCQCNAVAVTVRDKNPKVDEKVTISVVVGDLGSGKPLVDPGSESIDWGDGTQSKSKLGSVTYEHSYSKQGAYALKFKATGQFKWNADDGSCSYYCTAEKGDAVTVGVKVFTQEEVFQLLQKDKSQEAKAELTSLQQKVQQIKSATEKKKQQK